MAKSKKAREKYTSKGSVKNVSKKIKNGMKNSRAPGIELINKMSAAIDRKTSYVTIENPNKNQTSKPFIKVPARSYWSSSFEKQQTKKSKSTED